MNGDTTWKPHRVLLGSLRSIFPYAGQILNTNCQCNSQQLLMEFIIKTYLFVLDFVWRVNFYEPWNHKLYMMAKKKKKKKINLLLN